MGYAPRALLAGVLGLATSFLVACGGDAGLLSSNQANNLNSQLDRVSSAIDAGQCDAATSAINAFSAEVSNLPGSVSATLTRNLEQGASTVADLAAKDCQNQTTSATSSSTTSSSTTTTTTSTPTTTTTTPTTTTTTTTSTPTTTTTTSTATTQTGTGTTSTDSGSGGAGIGGGSGGGNGGTGGSGTGGNGNGNAQ